MSKPMPNKPHTSTRLMVLGAKPSHGITNGTAISPIAVRVSTSRGRCLSIGNPKSVTARRAEQPVWAYHQHQRHGGEQHHVGPRRVDHRGDTDDLAGDQAAQHGARKRADA